MEEEEEEGGEEGLGLQAPGPETAHDCSGKTQPPCLQGVGKFDMT